MARATTMLLVLVSCAVFATAVYAECTNTKVYTFEFFEHLTNDKLAFSPSSQQNGLTGNGYIYDNPCRKTYDPNSELYGFTGGLFVYFTATQVEEISTIYFNDIGEKGGTFADAEIHLRGVWNLGADGKDLPVQELSIVGGTQGLAGAYGTVHYTQVAEDVFLVQGKIFIDVLESSTVGHIAQVTSL
ncbi:hypothetical protein Mapa_009650 [Marchantia paleacea]|nr:hypothetical protein Mapa_009650 [Marchantia paleacea]